MSLSIFSDIAALDYRPLIWLNQFMSVWPRLDGFLAWLLNSNIVKFVPIVMVVCWLWFEKTSKLAFNRQILLESVFAAFAALFVARFLTLALPFRERPFANPDLHLAIPLEAGLRTWSSFPSDHAVMAFALAASLFRLSPRIGLWACLHAAVIICLPRLYFGLHYPSDLIGGALIGIALAFATSQLQGRHAVTRYLLEIEARNAAMFYAIGFLALFEIAEMFGSVRHVAVAVFHVLRQFLS